MEVCQGRGMFKVDFFASRLSHQLPQSGTDALQQIWGNQFIYAFPPFCRILQPLKKVSYNQTKKNVACHINLAVSNLVLPSSRNAYSLSTATFKEQKLKKLTSENSFSNCNNITTSGVGHIRERSIKKVISETAAQLVTSTR